MAPSDQFVYCSRYLKTHHPCSHVLGFFSEHLNCLFFRCWMNASSQHTRLPLVAFAVRPPRSHSYVGRCTPGILASRRGGSATLFCCRRGSEENVHRFIGHLFFLSLCGRRVRRSNTTDCIYAQDVTNLTKDAFALVRLSLNQQPGNVVRLWGGYTLF